jgi:putative addiction module CopG family antidote
MAEGSRVVSIPEDQADYIDRLVNAGTYASASEAVSAGIEALREREEETEWLREQVGPAYDAVTADPSTAIPASEVFAEIRRLHEERLKRG